MRALLEVISANGTPQFITPFVSISSVSYVYNGIGAAQGLVATSTPRLAELLNESNVYRIHPEGHAVFPCVLTSVQSSGQGVELGFKSAEYLMTGKVARQSIVQTGPASQIAREVFLSSTRNTPSPLSAGEFSADRINFVELTYPELYKTISDLAEVGDSAFWVDENFRVHFRNSRGQDKTRSLALFDGVHLTGVRVSLDRSEMVSHLVALGKSPSDSNAPRPIKTLSLPSSSLLARARVVEFNDYADAAQLVAPATEYLREHRLPRIAIDATLLDVGGVRAKVALGDLVTVVTDKVPGCREHTCRIVGLETAGRNSARLVLQVKPPPTGENAVEWRLS